MAACGHVTSVSLYSWPMHFAFVARTLSQGCRPRGESYPEAQGLRHCGQKLRRKTSATFFDFILKCLFSLDCFRPSSERTGVQHQLKKSDPRFVLPAPIRATSGSHADVFMYVLVSMVESARRRSFLLAAETLQSSSLNSSVSD